VRLATVLPIGLGLAASVPFALAQPSTSGPATAAPHAHSATEGLRSPAFEYLGTLSAKPGLARLSKTARRGAHNRGSSAAAWKAHVSGRRCRRPSATGSPTAPTPSRQLAESHSKTGQSVCPKI
jgi:hypothetical protein